MKFYFYIICFVLLKVVMSQTNMTEADPEPDIKVKYEMINETLFCISKGESYSKELISFAQKNRTINDYLDFEIEEPPTPRETGPMAVMCGPGRSFL